MNDRSFGLASRTWTMKEVAQHPLALKYELSERQFRRAVHERRIGFARPGGLVIRFTDVDVREFIEKSYQAPKGSGVNR